MRHTFRLLGLLLLVPLALEAQIFNAGRLRIQEDGTGLPSRPILNFVGTTVTCADDSGRITCTFTTGAPASAEYWVGAADATLSAEKNLGALGTGLVINTGGTPSAYGGTSCTNQFPRSLNASGAATCATVSLTADVTGATPIANGGTGQTTATAAFDALAPTTTQGDVIYHNGTDNVRLGAGTSGRFLQTLGAAANPVWASQQLRMTIVAGDGADGFNPADATSYYSAAGVGLDPSATYANHSVIARQAFTIYSIQIRGLVFGTAASAGNVTYSIRRNDSTDTSIGTQSWAGASPFSVTTQYTGLSIAVAQDDTWALKTLTPTWTTNPTIVIYLAEIWATIP